MNLRANVCEGYFRRFLYIFLGCFAYSMWCLYDGMIAYPAKLERAMVYHEQLDEAEDRNAEWLIIAQEKGWPEFVPETPAHIRNGITYQWGQIALLSLIGIPMLLKYVLAFGSYVEASETELKPSWRAPILISSISKIDKSRWQEKGIAKVFYQENQKTQKFVMDDFKYEREVMSEIMSRLESQSPNVVIIGGEAQTPALPESDTEKK